MEGYGFPFFILIANIQPYSPFNQEFRPSEKDYSFFLYISDMKLAVIYILFFIQIYANASKTDSLKSICNSSITYLEKFEAYEYLSNYYLNKDLDSAKYFIKQFHRLAEVHQEIDFLSITYNLKAKIASKEANYSEAIKYYQNVQKIHLLNKDSAKVSETYKLLGQTYGFINATELAVSYYIKSLELKEQINDLKGQASVFNSLASLYYDEGYLKDALSYYKKSLNIADKLNFKIAICIIKMNIANIYSDLDSANYKQIEPDFNSLIEANTLAIILYKESLGIAIDLNDFYYIAQIYSNLGIADSINSIFYFKKSFKIKEKTGDIRGQWKDLNNIANLYFDNKNYSKAQIYSLKALNLAEKNKLTNLATKTYRQFAIIQKELKNYKSAYENFVVYINKRDSIEKIETKTAFAEQEKKWNYEKREDENKLLKAGNELNEEKIAKQLLYLWASGIGIFLFVLLVIFILRGYRQKQRANLLLSEQKKLIEDTNEELNLQNEEIASQRDQIEGIHREVSESIDYAKRLQAAILPKPNLLKTSLSDHFILFMPKDKVSGDYYWWTEVEEQIIITAADCTGHGVPGAFMSMLGVSFLKEIVNKEYITQPALILKKLRREIIKTLGQKGIAGEQKDGMDMALISYNKQTKKLQYSGANNPLYIISKHKLLEQIPNAKIFDEGHAFTLYEIKPDKMPISIYEKMNPFTNTEVQLSEGDLIYMFSDGYADQFGGPKNKKFKYKPFKRLLLENAEKSLTIQKNTLNKAFDQWKGDEDQIDDVVVIGLKV